MKISTLIATLCITVTTGALAQVLPPIKARNLNKELVSWPQGLPAERTILIIAFERKHQTLVDGWVTGMRLKAPGAPAWFEVPIINNPGGMARWFIDNGMRGGIPNKADRARVVTVYGNKAALMASMKIADASAVHVLVVERSGRIVARESGGYSSAASAKLLNALKR
jgi:hypothetical protein